MVGFGSSLRIARRPGWEGAYLDYETLKLLLSQIEAVYEEEGHRRRRSPHVFDPSSVVGGGGEGGRKSKTTVSLRDYREELFLASDSDEAYLSVDDSNEECMSSNSSVPYEADKMHSANHHTHHHHHGNGAVTKNHHPTGQPFLLSYSKEPSSSDEENASGCGVPYSFTSWGWEKSSSYNAPELSEKKVKIRKNKYNQHLPEEDAFYMEGTNNSAIGQQHAFYMSTAMMMDEENRNRSSVRHSFLNAPVVMGTRGESSSLLPSGATTTVPTSSSMANAQGPVGSSLYTFSTLGSSGAENTTPPLPMYGSVVGGARLHSSAMMDNSSSSMFMSGDGGPGISGAPLGAGDQQHQLQVFADPVASNLSTSPMFSHRQSSQQQQHHHLPQQQQHHQNRPTMAVSSSQRRRLMEERKRDRRQRRNRRRRLRSIRKEREKKAPRHLRLAHSKARAITERFLGLLRAETEKVILFAQSRLGELADTAGSLRFTNIDDFDSNSVNHHHRSQSRRSDAAFDYPLSDAGLHPSASSSEDEGVAAGQGVWSDTSEEDKSERIPTVFAAMGGEEDATGGRRRKTHGKRAASAELKNGSTKTVTSSKQEDQSSNKAARVQEYANAAALRQIAHFTELRKRRPIFLRNDQILGEDMLLISAVEEVDGYTSLGVELIHVLRFICVNLIAVRKICYKHDRLLMNRMLGGYYHRTRGQAAIEDTQTLGGLIARNSGDIYEAHPTLIANMSQYKLVGLYDRKIQKLTNSRTVQVISSCLALALSEYEVARLRADALTKLNSQKTPKRSGGNDMTSKRAAQHRGKDGIIEPVDSDDELCEGAPSTASSISLTRLRFTVTSIFALEEAARYKTHHFYTYLSRSMLTFTGRPIIGEGLDGCSRATLDFFVAFNPDAALLLDTGVLFEGLNKGRWMQESLADLMVSTLGVATSPSASSTSPALMYQDLLNVVGCLNIDPESRQLDIKRFVSRGDTIERINYSYPQLPLMAVHLNAAGCLLYMMNYYMAHATTNTFVASTGAPYAYSSIVIGAPNLAALLVAAFHCFFLSADHSSHGKRAAVNVGLVWKLLIFSGVAGIAGNVINGVAIDKQSIRLALLGRFIIGFSSAEILHRNLVLAFWPSQVIPATAKVALSRMVGTLLGLALGICTEMVPLRFTGAGVRSMQFASWLMAFFWAAHIVRLLFQFHRKPPRRLKEPVFTTAEKMGDANGGSCEEYGDESSDSDHIGTPRSIWSSSKLAEDSVGLSSAGADVSGTVQLDDETAPLKQPTSKEIRTRGPRGSKTVTARLRKLLSYHVAIPALLFIVFYVSFAIEIFFTATPLITTHYFDWSGLRAGAVLVLLTVLVPLVIFFCERVARRFEERVVLKRMIVVASAGSFLLINWTSCFSLAQRVPNLLTEAENNQHTNTYDWSFGVLQYIFGVVVTYTGLVAVESATLSLLSKLSPLRHNVVLNLGTVVVVIAFLARIVADIQLLSVVLSHRLINTDIINTIAIPLFIFSFPIMYLIKRNFFYLM
ncbi:hypothetical protein ACA910_006342 [Epithemia clementina (nom. ined.)]